MINSMRRLWLEPSEIAVPAGMASAVGGHPLVAQTLARRGIATAEAARAFLDPEQYRPTSPAALPGLAGAVERLRLAIARQEAICVWGDFDVDGQTATTVLVSTLEGIGARVTYHIPVRARESHGVNLPVLAQVIDAGARLLLTCDTGIAAHAAVGYAQSRGVDVVITDHHDLPPDLPPACAVVNPKLLPADHALHELPGVGCAYKVAEELLIQAGQGEAAAQLLDLVALGAVADLARLTGDTRYLVQRGLEALRQTSRVGLQAILEGAELGATWLTEEHIGFELAPRLNALGRLADANMAVELLTTPDRGRARILASELEGLNAQRKLLCAQVFQAAQAQIERDPRLLDDAALVLAHPTWPAGVIGIVASRLVEIYQRPVVLIATPPGEMGRGSARSVEGCNITAAIAVHGEMLETFGGHPMAAGLAIDPERIPRFRRALARTIAEMCGGREGSALVIDGYLPLADLSLAFVADTERLAPCGPGNPPLTLVSRGVKVSKAVTIGRTGEHRQVTVEDETGVAQRVIWWQGADQPLPEGRFDLAYSVRASDFRGRRDVQIEWIDARPVAPESMDLRPTAPAMTIVDWREMDPSLAWSQLQAVPGVQVWREGEVAVTGSDRHGLVPGEALAIWSAPPGPDELRGAIARGTPQVVYLVGVDPGLDQARAFLLRLAGLVKYALRAHGGRIRVSALAAATAQREATVRQGIAWLVAHGDIASEDSRGDEMKLAAGDGVVRDLAAIGVRLNGLLAEAAAYRGYFRRVSRDKLVREMSVKRET